MKLLVTGGAGFIASNYIRMILAERPDDEITNLDKLTYAGNLENLRDIESNPRYKFVRGDIADSKLVDEVMSAGFDAVINFAAESHVDRSIESSYEFLRTNIIGTQTLMDSARKYNVARFVQVSTDEVYGSLGPTGFFREDTPLHPNSPYSSSKAGGDLLVNAYCHTFGFPGIITRGSNNYGPYQFPEKIIPLFITNAIEDKPLPIYGDGLYVRDWIYVLDHCRGIDAALRKGKVGETYLIGGGNELTNLALTDKILTLLGKPHTLKTTVKDRPGHDRRYALDISKSRNELGWEPRYKFDDALKATVEWYLSNRDWWMKIKSGEYLSYYDRMYGSRGAKPFSNVTGG